MSPGSARFARARSSGDETRVNAKRHHHNRFCELLKRITRIRLRPGVWRIAAPVLVGAALLALWEAVVRIEQVPPYILPGPLLIAQTLWSDGPSLLGSLLVTLRITVAALAAAAILGGAIAVL